MQYTGTSWTLPSLTSVAGVDGNDSRTGFPGSHDSVSSMNPIHTFVMTDPLPDKLTWQMAAQTAV